MGAENLRISAETSLPPDAAAIQLLQVPGASTVADSVPSMRAIQLRGADHVFEVEIWPSASGCRMTFSIAVCHPVAALPKLASLVSEMIATLGLRAVRIREDYPGAEDCDYGNADRRDFSDAVAHAFLHKRGLWIADFGTEEAAVTADEALRKFVMSRKRIGR